MEQMTSGASSPTMISDCQGGESSESIVDPGREKADATEEH